MNNYSGGKSLRIRTVDIPKETKIPEWWIQDIIPKGRLMLLSAGGGTGKTSLCTYLAKMLYDMQGVTSAYWAFEDDPTDFTNKIGYTPGMKLIVTESVQKAYDEDGEYEKTSTGFFDFNDEDHWEQLSWAMQEADARILIVDPVAQLYGSDENDGQKVRQFMIKFNQFAQKENITIIAIHHNRKDTRAGGNNARGSSSWTDVPRHHLIFAKNDLGQRLLEVEKSNLTQEGLSWEVFFEIKELQDNSSNIGTVFAVTGLVQVEDYAVRNSGTRTDNTPLVVKRLKEKFLIGQNFNLDDIKKCGSFSEFYRVLKDDSYGIRESAKKKDGKKAWIFVQ